MPNQRSPLQKQQRPGGYSPRIDDLETARGITLIHGPLIEDDREEHKCYRHNEGAHAKPNE